MPHMTRGVHSYRIQRSASSGAIKDRDSVWGRVSHGCVRMRNADVVKLARLMPLGTPITIR